MSEIPRLNVEREFAECVSKMGGTVSDVALFGRATKPRNADFVFAEDGVVIELKCLEADWSDELAERAPRLTAEWMRAGKIPARSGTFNLAELPIRLVRDILLPFKRRLESIIKEANRQIKQSRVDLGNPAAKGLLVLVNEGNYAVPPQMMSYLLERVFAAGTMSAIHSVAYLSVNEDIAPRSAFSATRFWAWVKVAKRDAVSTEFQDRFASAWMSHMSLVTGALVAEVRSEMTYDEAAGIKFTRANQR